MKQYLQMLLSACLVIATASMAFGQGATTGSMRGIVLDNNGESLIGATVSVVHQSSGTTYGTVSNIDGKYNIPNMKVGGPYTVTASYLGYNTVVLDNQYINLGEKLIRDFVLSEESLELEGVEVVAQRVFAGEAAGTSTQVNEEEIKRMPTLNNNLNDFTRLTPQARTTVDGGFSIAGVNNRYNAIYIDGAVNNDVYGLSSSGTNGGQTGVAPFSMDIVEQIQVVLSPYDVTYGGFAGGGINAVTKSGTNTFSGSAYYYLQNESLAGKTNGKLTERTGSEATKLDQFNNKLYGFTLGGPIIKDKLFFFANAEFQDNQTPSPYDFGIYEGESSEADLNNLANTLRDEYGYDPGGFGDKLDKLESQKFFAKLDYNINDNHKITLRHQYTKGEQTSEQSSTSTRINFANNGVYFPSTTNSSALEWNSSYGTKFSNSLILGYTTVLDDRDPIGGNFPWVSIEDGSGDIRFGSEEFSTANQLEQDIFTITNNFKVYSGDHTITAGIHFEFNKFYNLFIRQNFGSYDFDSVDDFLNNVPAADYDRSYSLVDDVTGDGSKAAGEFNAMQLGFYLQDEWSINRRFTLTGGLRFDIPVITTDPNVDNSFNNVTLPLLMEKYDLQGAVSGKMPEGQLMISPRLGFNYDVKGNGTTILRGGLGVFTSRIPFVWPGGAFVNNGLTIGGVDADDIIDGGGEVIFIPEYDKQYTNPNFSVPSGQIDLFAKDFKYPQVFRMNLAIDKEIFGGYKATLEGMYTKTLNNVYYQNVNSDPEVDFNWTGSPDDRRVYVGESIDPTYSAVYLASNTSDGSTYNITASLEKRWVNGVNAFVAYTYGDAEAVFEGTSSQNSSQWRGAMTVNGRNFAQVGRSDFALGSRVVGGVAYALEWDDAKNFVTTFSLLYEGVSGDVYSYVYGGRSGQNPNNERGSTSRNRSLVWVPGSRDEINLIDYESGGATITADEQWANLSKFIEEDEWLNDNKGGYADKNSNRTPWQNNIDLRIAQDLGAMLGSTRNRLQISLDIINFGNLLNKNWGVAYSRPRDAAYEFITFEGYGADGTTPEFTYRDTDLGDERYDIADRASRWRMRLGFRYIFN